MLAVARTRFSWAGVWFSLSCLAPATVLAQVGAPVSDTTTEGGETSLPWRGSTLTFSQALSVDALSHSAQLSYDPIYAWSFILEPRWYLNKTTYLNLDQRLSIELTDSDTTLKRQRAMLSDTILGADTRLLTRHWAELGDLGLKAGLHAIAPTSLASQAATMVIGARGRVTGLLHLAHVLRGADIVVQGRYLHRFLRHDTLEAVTPFPCLAGGLTSQNCSSLGSASNVRDELSMIVSASLSLSERFDVSLLAWLTWDRGSQLRDASITTDTGLKVDIPDTSTTHWHNARYLLVSLDYHVNNWLGLGLSLINSFAERSPDGALRAPGRPVDTLFGLSTEISLDGVYQAVRGRPAAHKP